MVDFLVWEVLSLNTPEVVNPAPGDPMSCKNYFQPASTHLPLIFKQS